MPNQGLAKPLSVFVDRVESVYLYPFMIQSILKNLKNIYNISDLTISTFSKRLPSESVKMSYK